MTPQFTAARRLALIPLLLSAAACGDGGTRTGTSGSTHSAEYVGLLASTGGLTGPLNLTFASPVGAPPIPQLAGTGPGAVSVAPVDVTGTLSLIGPLVAIAGQLDDADVLIMSGGGYSLTGTLDNSLVVGSFSGPAGASGTFVAASSSTTSPALAFCGTFTGQDFEQPPTQISGSFSLVVSSGAAVGVAYEDAGIAIPLEGTSTSSAITINQDAPDLGGQLSVSGTYNSTSMSGIFSVSATGTILSEGTFSATICSAPI